MQFFTVFVACFYTMFQQCTLYLSSGVCCIPKCYRGSTYTNSPHIYVMSNFFPSLRPYSSNLWIDLVTSSPKFISSSVPAPSWLMVLTLLMPTLILLIEPSRAKYLGRLLLFAYSPQLLFVILTSFLKDWFIPLPLHIWSTVPDFKVSPHLTTLAISFAFIFQMLIFLYIYSQAHKMLSFQEAVCSTICNVSNLLFKAIQLEIWKCPSRGKYTQINLYAGVLI